MDTNQLATVVAEALVESWRRDDPCQVRCAPHLLEDAAIVDPDGDPPLLVSSIPQGPHLRLGLLARLHELPPPRSQLVGDEHVELVVAKNESLHRNLFNFFVQSWYILDVRCLLISRRFRICVAKGGRGCFRPSYGRPKLTLFSKKKSTKMSRRKKQARPQFSKYRFQNESAWAHSL